MRICVLQKDIDKAKEEKKLGYRSGECCPIFQAAKRRFGYRVNWVYSMFIDIDGKTHDAKNKKAMLIFTKDFDAGLDVKPITLYFED